MEKSLNRVREQVNSKLDNQKQVAITLVSIEETLESSGQDKLPSAYFSILLVLLEQDEGKNRINILYLLDLVLPYVSSSILRLKLSDILNIFSIVLDEEIDSAPILRSSIGCLSQVIQIQEKGSWSLPLLKKTYQNLLALCVDKRPKVRRRAQLSVVEILEGKEVASVVFLITSDFCLNKLKLMKKGDKEGNGLVTFLTFVKSCCKSWPTKELLKLFQVLTALPKLNNQFLTPVVYSVFAIILENVEEESLDGLLKNLIELKPNVNEMETYVGWSQALHNGYLQIFENNPEKIFKLLPKILNLILSDLDNSNFKINSAISQTIQSLVESVDGKYDDLTSEQENSVVGCYDSVQECLSYRYRNAYPQVFNILESFYRVFGPLLPSAVIPTLQILDGLRLEPEFNFKPQLSPVLGQALQSIGIRRFLSTLPLNLENPNEQTVGRAWLLPLLKDYVINSDLTFFTHEFVELAKRLTKKAEQLEKKGASTEAKIYFTLAYQIWSLFPSFANFPHNLADAFTSNFAELIANQLYHSPDLRTNLCTGLALLIESNRRLIPANNPEVDLEVLNELYMEYNLDPNEAQNNLNHLAQFATNYLAVLFNLYESCDSIRSTLLQTILAFLTITNKKQIHETFQKVLAVLQPQLSEDEEIDSATLATTVDLTLILIPYLNPTHLDHLFQIATNFLTNDEVSLQKRGYKLLSKLIQNCQLNPTKSGLMDKLLHLEYLSSLVNLGSEVQQAATKDRLALLLLLIPQVPLDQFHILAQLTSEIILNTKEVNEKARELAFQLLVVIARRMHLEEGTIVPQHLGIQRDGLIQASLHEFMMLVVAGLTGTTPHMLSATINSLSRLLFEFHHELEDELISELISTMELFVTSTNREIVKASLGFVKVLSVTLTQEQLRPHLPMLLKNILKWANDLKSKFKVKVRHIVERFLRKFGLEELEKEFPEEHVKLLNNIKKRKIRAKRLSKHVQDGEEEQLNAHQPHLAASSTKMNAFEDALYGSESELESDSEAQPKLHTKRKANQQQATYLLEDKLEDLAPTDFLNKNVISRITNTKPKSKLNKELSAKSQFKTDAFGKLMFKEDSEDEESKPNEPQSKAKEENYYLEAIQSKDGFDRVNNKIKFKKGNKEDDFLDDEEDSTLTKPTQDKFRKPSQVKKLGGEYKSKKAKGDMMSAGKLDPYAYVPLNPKMVPRKGKKAEKLNILKR